MQNILSRPAYLHAIFSTYGHLQLFISIRLKPQDAVSTPLVTCWGGGNKRSNINCNLIPLPTQKVPTELTALSAAAVAAETQEIDSLSPEEIELWKTVAKQKERESERELASLGKDWIWEKLMFF